MSLFEDTYHTIANSAEGIFRDKGSKFIAYAYPFTNEDRLKEIIAELKILHPKARHHCWAYRIGPDRTVYRLNDDGEPSGTAGRPILNVLLSQDVTNILIVVVRYFGGTLLGVPGLINAYKTATQEVLAAVEIVEKTVNDLYKVEFDYLAMNDVMRVIKEENITVNKQVFDNACYMEVEVRKMQINAIVSRFDKIDNCTLTYLSTM